MKVSVPIVLLAALAAATPVMASELKTNPKAVLELFTSQGCSSCPPADALLKSLQPRADLITLAYHVDYWDYIGWTDTFDSKESTDRQRSYASAWGSNKVYTPQLVVNGARDVVGSNRGDVESAIAAAALPVPVSLKPDTDGMLQVDAGGKAGEQGAGVWLVTYIDKADVKVERGENAGRELAYTQVVTGRHILGMWDPQTGAHLKLPLDEVLTAPSNGAVILVQAEKNGLPGPILGAAAFTR